MDETSWNLCNKIQDAVLKEDINDILTSCDKLISRTKYLEELKENERNGSN